MTPRRKIANRLWDLGYAFNEEDFSIVRGPKRFQDILECWNIFATKDGRRWEITSGYTMTDLARSGFNLIPNTRNSDFYGDLITEPLNSETNNQQTQQQNAKA